MKATMLAAGLAVFFLAPAQAETPRSERFCLPADMPEDMCCEKQTAFMTVRDGYHDTARIFDSAGLAETRRRPKCVGAVWHKSKPPCVLDPAEDEPTCGYESRMAVARRHGFIDLPRFGMSETIAANPTWARERDRAFKACMIKNNFCEYRDD